MSGTDIPHGTKAPRTVLRTRYEKSAIVLGVGDVRYLWRGPPQGRRRSSQSLSQSVRSPWPGGRRMKERRRMEERRRMKEDGERSGREKRERGGRRKRGEREERGAGLGGSEKRERTRRRA
eukprot:1691810-Rhodomonas_salina.1